MRIRIAFTAALAAIGLIVLSPGAAQAHGDTLRVLVTGQRDGHVTAEVTWENDGDPVEENVAATVNAVSADGSRTQGPWRLVRAPKGTAASWTTAEALPPGAWKVSVDAGFPGLGHGALDVAVPVVDPAPTAPAPTAPITPVPPATPSTSATGTGTPTPTLRPSTASAAPAGHGSAVWWTTGAVAVAVAALAGAAVGVYLRRRRAGR